MRGYEADPDKQRDLFQEIQLNLWVSLKSFDGRCSLRTWTYRIAHNVGAAHVALDKRLRSRLLGVEEIELSAAESSVTVQALLDLIHRLKPLDRQIILLYLEGETASAIAEVTGFSASNVATKIHRIKRVLREQLSEGVTDARP